MHDISPMTRPYEAKVIVLGDGEAGKTLLISRLMNGGGVPRDYDGEGGTGITVKRWMYENGERTTLVNFWDFNGQAIHHTLHRVFMTPRAVYVIVVNVRDDSQEERARFWLNTVKMAAPEAPVLLVLNKIDQNPYAAINASALRVSYPNLQDVIRVSAMEYDQDEFVRSFGFALTGIINQYAVAPQPESWYFLRDNLCVRDFRYISMRNFHKLCDQYRIKAGEIGRMLQWLSDCGVVFLVKDDGALICNPGWIMDALFRVLRIPSHAIQNGMIYRIDLPWLLYSSQEYGEVRDYTHDDTDCLLRVMRHFGLSIQLDDDLEFLPMLCDRNTNPIAWEYRDDEYALEVRVDFDYLPDSVIHRLMAGFIGALDTDKVWYTGAHFVLEPGRAAALVLREDDSVVLYIRCDEQLDPAEYLHPMLEALERIRTEFGLGIMDRKVVYKQGGLRELFSYDMLMGTAKAGRPDIYSHVFGRLLSIDEILKRPDAKKQAIVKKLVADVAQACGTVLHFYGGRPRTEDDLNAVVRKNLWQKGHMLADYRLLGLPSRTSLHNGEVDMVLLDEHRQPLTMIEAMRFTGSTRPNLNYWNEKLGRLLMQCTGMDPELSMVFMINYAECPGEAYSGAWQVFRDHIRWYDPDRMKRKEGSGTEILLDGPQDPFLHIAKCDYDFRGRTITVYQYFVWVEPASMYTGKGEESKNPAMDSTNPYKDVFSDPPPRKAVPKTEQNARQPQTSEALARKEYRVVFLGDSEAGKSLLLERVVDPENGLQKFDDKTTPGISIKPLLHTVDGTPVRVNFWDFGGQEILHSLHRMFLDTGTLYVIVLNTRNDNHDAQADFWMRYVQAYAYGAPVLFVLNKTDQNPKAKLNLPVLNRHFSTDFKEADVLRACAIDKDWKKFAREFTARLLERVAAEVKKYDEFSDPVAAIRAAVEERKKADRIIKTDDFRRLCRDAGLTDPKQWRELLMRFHRAGILVCFGTEYKMLLDPQWITKAIYAVLEEQDELSGNGIIAHEKLEDLYFDKLSDSEYAKFVLEVMRDYGLSYRYQSRKPEDADSENLEFIPMLCRREEPDAIHQMTQAERTIVMEMHFEYLPTGVLYQLMVKFAGCLDPEFVWRSGARFRFGSLVSAIVRQDANVMQLYIHYETEAVKGKALEHMEKLMDETRAIAERGKATAKLLEIKLQYMVGTIPEFFDYKQLKNAQTSRVYYVASKLREKRKIFVDDILKQEDGWETQLVRRLLERCLDGARELQGNQTYWFRHQEAAADKTAPKMGEDQRTHLFKAMLKDGFSVSEQQRWRASASGVSEGELDLKIDTKDGDALAILEALNITGDNKASRESWKEHLSRMMNSYNQNGLRHLLLVSYLDCDKKRVGAVQDAYLELLRTYEVPKYGAPEELITDLLPACPNEIQVVQADYYADTGIVSVYHFLIHISRYTGQNETEKKSSGRKKKKEIQKTE